MLTSGIRLLNFKKKSKSGKIKQHLNSILKDQNEVIKSLTSQYKNSYKIKNLKKYKNSSNFKVIGMGGSVLGTKTIYDFLGNKIKKNFIFIDNINNKQRVNKKKKSVNLIVSKSGNTIETIVNANILISPKDNNIFITENKKNYLRILGEKLKADIIDHNNYIGGRYSVLSEVGMLPANLMGLNEKKFKQLNSLIKNKTFFNSLISNVGSTLFFIKKKKFNSIIINYDEQSESLFKWYQQLVAESLGKKSKGLLPIVSNMPKDNHSVMQLYLDGFQNNFFTFFYCNEAHSKKLKSSQILPDLKYLRGKNLSHVTYAQKKATEIVFGKKKIPFRSFEIKKRDEKTLGELFCFFILETILIGKSLNLNPFDQPAVELIKAETKRILT